MSSSAIPSRLTIKRRMARPAAMAAIIAVALATAAPLPASADPVPGAERIAYAEHVDLAGAAFLTVTDSTSTILEVRIFDSDQPTTSSGPVHSSGPGIVLFYTHTEIDPETGFRSETNYEGFSGGAGATFDFDRALKGARAQFPLNLYGYRCVYPPDDGSGGPQGIDVQCEELDPAVVNANLVWTGYGPIVRDTTSDRYNDPPFLLFGVHSVLAVRDAAVSGSIAGDGLTLVDGPADFAVLLRGKYHEQVVVPPVRR